MFDVAINVTSEAGVEKMWSMKNFNQTHNHVQILLLISTSINVYFLIYCTEKAL
jgi:hypothetical protein